MIYSFCRLTITLFGCAVKMMFVPFRSAAGGGGGRGYGHLPTNTMDYQDPYRPGANKRAGAVELS